ncbi:MAG TPA: PAS domain-containing protein [Thermoanaerobaculia bacterium]|nr:PAS domain-containing protein [Thermoanaerobaculia bacterium]
MRGMEQGTPQRTDRASSESETRFRSFADIAPAKLWVTEPDGSCSFLSRGWYEFTGQTEETGLGFGWLDAVHPDDAPRSRDIFLEANAKREPFELEHRLRRADGEYRWVIDAGRPRFGPGGEFLGYIGSVIDVHERTEAQESLRINRERLDLVVNSGQIGLWYCDLPFDKLNWNAKVKEHFGLPADYDVTIDTFFERLHPDDRERTGQAIEKSIADRTDYDIEYRTLGLDGRERWIRALGRATYHDGKPVRFDGITVDVTERVRQEEALKEADRRKDEFLATLAHELRNPLAPLRNGLQIMRLAAHDPATVERTRTMMERQLGHMVRLIDDLLDLSRISRGKIELRKERVELAEVVWQAVETSRPAIEEAGLELTVHLAPDPIFVDADLTRMTQVFANLLNNAAKFTERGGHVWLTVERRGDQGVVSVKDDGVGIPAHQIARVFDMFTQVDQSLERARGGLGIGLSLVRGLVEMHGGTVEAKSEGRGRGSELVVRLPVAVPLTEEPLSVGSETAAPGNRRRVLVVDDNRDAALSLAMMLELMGHETRTAHDGLEAFDVAAAFRPNLILLDIGMPKMNGCDTARLLRQQPWGQSLMLVALTGWGQEEDRRTSMEAGFDSHLVKPIEPATLETLLARLRTVAGELPRS